MAERISWIDPAGVETVLNDGVNCQVLRGRKGAFAPPVSFIEEEVPGRPGARYRQTKILPRNLDLPLLVRGTDPDDLRGRIGALVYAMDPDRGEGRIRVRSTSGEQRELFCRYAAGLEGEEGGELWGGDWAKFLVSFRAVDPHWYSTYPLVRTYSIGDAALFFPLLPLNIAPSTLFVDDMQIENPGDHEAWPVWDLLGPGSDITLTNLTTGDSLSLTITLAAGEHLYIDTRPGVKTVKHQDGTNAYDHLSATSRLWPLAVGINVVDLTMGGSSTDSQITLSFTPAYKSVPPEGSL
ncbi:MAG: phage distal tail protein [Sphingomonadaceae bacterium]